MEFNTKEFIDTVNAAIMDNCKKAYAAAQVADNDYFIYLSRAEGCYHLSCKLMAMINEDSVYELWLPLVVMNDLRKEESHDR